MANIMDNIFVEIIKIAFLATLPIGLITAGIYYRAFLKGLLSETNCPKALKQEIKKKKKAKDKSFKKTGNLLHDRWFKFGGGFYGLMALITYIVVEVDDLYSFFANFDSWAVFLQSIGFNMLVTIIIDAIKNLVTALTWFLFWGDVIETTRGLLWIIGAYIGYMAGIPLAQRYFNSKFPDGLIDEGIIEESDTP